MMSRDRLQHTLDLDCEGPGKVGYFDVAMEEVNHLKGNCSLLLSTLSALSVWSDMDCVLSHVLAAFMDLVKHLLLHGVRDDDSVTFHQQSLCYHHVLASNFSKTVTPESLAKVSLMADRMCLSLQMYSLRWVRLTHILTFAFALGTTAISANFLCSLMGAIISILSIRFHYSISVNGARRGSDTA